MRKQHSHALLVYTLALVHMHHHYIDIRKLTVITCSVTVCYTCMHVYTGTSIYTMLYNN